MKFLTMIYQHGPSRGRRILSARAVAAMLSDQTGGAPMAESPFPGALYGIGNWLDNPDGTGGASQHGCMGVAGWTPLIDAATGFLAVVGMQDMLLLFRISDLPIFNWKAIGKSPGTRWSAITTSMGNTVTRREALLGLAASAGTLLAAARPSTIETHVHLFDPARVPYAPDAPYKPPAYTLEDHVKLVEAAGLAHSIIVHPEPYQDDHRYLEYCFAHEPRPGYFKGTCLFDPLREDTPRRMRALAERWPKRIVALRIHEMSMTPETGGPIRNRDPRDPLMAACWRAVTSMGMAVQMHFIPAQAPNIRALAEKFPETTVILDHMGRPGQGTDQEYDAALKLAELPRVILKYSNWGEYKGDLGRLTRRIYDAFGPERIIWGMVGSTAAEYRKQSERFEELLAFAPEADRARIRGGNAQRLFFG